MFGFSKAVLSHNNPTGWPTRVEAHHFGNAKIVSVTGGEWHSAAVTETGDLYTWGVSIAIRHAGTITKKDAHARRPSPAARRQRARLALPQRTGSTRPCLHHGPARAAGPRLHLPEIEGQNHPANHRALRVSAAGHLARAARAGAPAGRWLDAAIERHLLLILIHY